MNGQRAGAILTELTTFDRRSRISVSFVIVVVSVLLGILVDVVWPKDPSRSALIGMVDSAFGVITMVAAFWPIAATSVLRVRVDERLRALAGLKDSPASRVYLLYGPAVVMAVPVTAYMANKFSDGPAAGEGLAVLLVGAVIAYITLAVVSSFHSMKTVNIVRKMVYDDYGNLLATPLQLIKDEVRPEVPQTIPQAFTHMLDRDAGAAIRRTLTAHRKP